MPKINIHLDIKSPPYPEPWQSYLSNITLLGKATMHVAYKTERLKVEFAACKRVLGFAVSRARIMIRFPCSATFSSFLGALLLSGSSFKRQRRGTICFHIPNLLRYPHPFHIYGQTLSTLLPIYSILWLFRPFVASFTFIYGF